MPVMEYQPLYRVSEVAKILKIRPADVYQLMNTGKLTYVLLGSKKIRGIDLERFINQYPADRCEGR